jgi:hemolysin D
MRDKPNRPYNEQMPLFGWFLTSERDDFDPGVLEIEDAPAAPLRRTSLAVIAALVVTALVWGWFGRLDVYAEAPGKIQVTGRSKVVEPALTGQVAAIEVHDGNRVREGDVLVRLDPTAALATQAERAAQLADIRAELARWPIEIAGAHADPVDPDAPIPWTGQGADAIPAAARLREQDVLRADLANLASTIATLQAERRQKEVQRDGLVATIAAQNAVIATQKQYLTMVMQLEREGWNSHAKLLETQAADEQEQLALAALQNKLADTQAAIPVIEGQILAARETLSKTGEQQLATLGQQAEDLAQQLAEATQAVTYMTLRAPISGTVAASAITTVGQVVRPGNQLMQIVPDNNTIEAVAYVPNTSIGFIREGQPVDMKVKTFLWTNYGTVPGKVTQVAHDALALLSRDTLQVASLDGDASKTTTAQETGTLAYPITISADRTSIRVGERELPLTPGMMVTVDLLTERRRVLDYLISPLKELFWTAAHER